MKLGAYKAGDEATDKYIATTGPGYDYSDYEGRFEVKSDGYGVKEFTNSLEAIKFYESIDAEAALWDFIELLEMKERNPRYRGQ
jgi:hypothetical protein